MLIAGLSDFDHRLYLVFDWNIKKVCDFHSLLSRSPLKEISPVHEFLALSQERVCPRALQISWNKSNNRAIKRVWVIPKRLHDVAGPYDRKQSRQSFQHHDMERAGDPSWLAARTESVILETHSVPRSETGSEPGIGSPID